MKKKVWYLLLFCVVPHRTYATPFVTASQKRIANEVQGNETHDTYQPITQNYIITTIEAIKHDWLHEYKSTQPQLSISHFSWENLLRWPYKNFSCLYAIRINKSRFAICGGMGFSTLQYAFKKDKSKGLCFTTLHKKGTKNTVYDAITAADLGGDDWGDDGGDIQPHKVSSSVWNISYLDFLVRVRFNRGFDQPNEGIHVWLGGKLGIRTGSTTTIKYSANDTSNSLSRVNDFNLNRCAITGQIGAGYSYFGLIGSYTFTPLFSENVLKKDNNTALSFIRPFSLSFYFSV